jgi:hypothetical protein
LICCAAGKPGRFEDICEFGFRWLVELTVPEPELPDPEDGPGGGNGFPVLGGGLGAEEEEELLLALCSLDLEELESWELFLLN